MQVAEERERPQERVSEEQLAVVRRILDAFNRRDVNAVIRESDPEIAFFAPTTVAADRRYDLYRGHDGIRIYFGDVERIWEELRLYPRDFRCGSEGIVVLGTVEGRARDGDGMLESGVAWAWRIKDGKVVWGRVYTTPDDALADLDIS